MAALRQYFRIARNPSSALSAFSSKPANSTGFPAARPPRRRAKGCCKAAAQPVSLVSQSEMNRRVIADITQSHLAIISRQVI
ncbi:hypothetical protein DF048_21475 [Burkholderia seminalis]|nr:hypothetical protein DF048_21475 [Burkholderia seminalis]